MSEFIKILNAMCDLGYILALNTSGNIIFEHFKGESVLQFKNWDKVAAYIHENKEKK